MKKQLLLLFFIVAAVTLSYSQELLIVDLTVQNQITITATTNTSAATVSGSDTTGFYLENFFLNDPNDQALTATLVTGTLTSASETTDTTPSLFRGSGGDPGLNCWSYTDDPNSTFTSGQQAFSGQGTWSLDQVEYDAMITAPSSGNIYFPADTVDDLTGATLIGTYTVVFPNLSISDVESNDFNYYPNPVKDELNISSQVMIDNVDVYNVLGQRVKVQKLNRLSGTVNTSSLARGTYILRVNFQDGTSNTFNIVKE